MDIRYLRYLMMMVTVVLSMSLTSCGNDDDDEDRPDPGEDEVEASIVGKWTVEDYRTGQYSTFEFMQNGLYTLTQPYYEAIDKAIGRYHYDPLTKVIYFEHYYQDYDFGNPDLATDLKVKCFVDNNSLTLIGNDCEEFGLPNPVELKKGGYSGVCPDFKNLLCSMGVYTERSGYLISEDVEFEFFTNGRVDFRYKILSDKYDGNQGYGEVIATGTFSVEKYFLNCRFTTVSKSENNLGYASTSLWEKFTDHQSATITFYLALDDNDKVVISDYPLYK